MANVISSIKLPNEDTYNFKVFSNNIAPIEKKIYTGTSYYASAANQNNSTWYFMSVKPETWNKVWRVGFKLHTYVPSYPNENSITFCTISGRQNGFTYMNFNDFDSTGHYYISCYPLTQTGFNAGYGHAIGNSIFYASNYTSSAHYRTFEVQLYDVENCTITWLDTPVKWSAWTGTGTTNYGGLSNLNASSRGLQETGDANDPSYNNRIYYSSIWKTAAPLYRYQLVIQKELDTLLPFNSVNNNQGTTKAMTTQSFNPFGEIYYYGTTTNYTTIGTKIGANATLYKQYHSIDLRYSFNTGSTLTAWKFIYLVCVPQTDGSVKLHTTPIVQDLPSTEDGLLYIRLGWAINTTNMELAWEHPVYKYVNGKVIEYHGSIDDNYWKYNSSTDSIDLIFPN